jgi:apolipoprotein N-acyltransferase
MDLKHETTSLIQVGAGLLTSLLVMTGIAGTIYNVIAPGGWIAQAFGHSFKAGLSLLLGVLLLLGFGYLSRTWTPSQKHRNFTANLVVALFALAGFVYLAHFWATGGL